MKKEEIQRWLLKLILGESGLRSLDDVGALASMRETHLAYRNFKDAEARKERAESELKQAGNDLARAFKGYGDLRDLPWSAPDYSPGFSSD